MAVDLEIAKKAAQNWQERAQPRETALMNLRQGNITAVESPERIQKRLDHLNELAAAPPPQPAAAIIGPALVDDFTRERIIGFDDLMDINRLQLALAVSRFVGRVNIRAATGGTIGYGTGFMVSPRLFLTNHHVLPAAQDAAPSRVEFDYQLDTLGRLLPVHTFPLDPQAFFLTSEKLDFSLVAVRPTAIDGTELKYFGWLRLIGAEGKILIGDPVNIIQHPNGNPKQIAFRNNRLLDLFDIFGHYETDTEPGSSGSPVFNDQWEVVALHHSGVPRTKDGQLLTKDGSVWKNGMDPDQIDWVANEGIRVSRLASHIKKQRLSGEPARLRRELLDLEPPHPLELAAQFAGLSGEAQPVRPAAKADGAGGFGAGEFTINIPLQITIRLGTPELPGATTVTGLQPSVTTAVTPGGASTQTTPAAKTKPADKKPPSGEPAEPPEDVQAALAELAAADTRVYYDQQADLQDSQTYYAAITCAPEPAAFFQELHDLLVRTHTRPVRYKPSTHVYPWIDLHQTPEGMKILSIYSGQVYDPAEFILADFRIEQERERLTELQEREAVFSPLSEAARLDLLEASLPYNCEHVVPQSWFQRAEPMRGDLHHLFAVESGCNSFRRNTPYFDFPDFDEVIRENCGRVEVGKFEPNTGKGAIARAVLYFLLRYPGEINATTSEYTPDRLQIFHDWHSANPPDVYEKHRNQAIFEKQGNRNPLIDHPEWAARIDFALGLGPE